MENTLMDVDMIKNMGMNGGAINPDVTVSMIATSDIAKVAVDYLTNRNFSGKVAKELLGQRDLNMAEATKIIGEKIGKPDLKYTQFPYEDYEKSLIQAGLSEDMSKSYVELSQAANEGILEGTETRSAENTTATPFEEFANVFTRIFKD
jgi:hypothetical protein